MKDKVFIDTNIFIYLLLKQNTEEGFFKHKKANEFFDGLEENSIVISVQILNELYVNLLKNKIPEIEILNSINDIISDCEVISLELNLIKNAWELKNKYNLSYWDSIVVSSALISECKVLYSEDMQNGLLVEGKLKIINPFSE
ncbi:MAG: PIN domain-containing protein [Leptospiraceae bacterium]|nr:PIN domain-containing protein [Leptospiraceae bacterium]